MAAQIYIYTSIAGIACDSCRNVVAGDQVDIALRQDLIPALPVSVRAVVQLVDGLIYSLEYDDDDLLGAAVEIAGPIVGAVTCVSELAQAREYSDASDAAQNVRLTNIESSLAALGVVPSDNGGAFVVHPDSTPGVSVEAIRHDKVIVPNIFGSETVVLDILELASPLAVLDLTGLSYRLEADVSLISNKPIDNRDSQAQYVMVGQFDSGGTVSTISLDQRDAVTVTAVKVGNNLHISVNNPSSGIITAYVTSKFRILS